MFSDNRFPNLSVDMKSTKSTQKRIYLIDSLSPLVILWLYKACVALLCVSCCVSEGKNFRNV